MELPFGILPLQTVANQPGLAAPGNQSLLLLDFLKQLRAEHSARNYDQPKNRREKKGRCPAEKLWIMLTPKGGVALPADEALDNFLDLLELDSPPA